MTTAALLALVGLVHDDSKDDRSPSSPSSGKSPADGLEMSPEVPPTFELASQDRAPSAQRPRRFWIFTAVLYFFFFTMGCNAGSTGPLLPRFQEFYRIDFVIASMVFVSNACGSMTAAILTHTLKHRMRHSRLCVIVSVIPLASFSIMASQPPFGVMCLCFYLNGINFAMLNIQGNGILSLLPNKTPLSLGHSFFGLGALVAPLVATQFAQIPRWTFYYLIMVGFAICNFLLLLLLFRGREWDDILAQMGVEAPTIQTAVALSIREEETNQPSALKRWILPVKLYTPLLAAFMFVCVGIEVSIGGWIVTFIMRERGGGMNSGYVATGYYAGLALGRALLIKITKLLGERKAVTLYICLGISLEFTIWFVKSLIANAVAAAVIGSLIGPLFPILMSEARRLIPRRSLASSIGWISGIGNVGSAVLPFVTGVLANQFGIIALHPLVIAMMTVLAAIWLCVPAY